MSKPLEISEIPTAALVETYEKYRKALYTGTVLWAACDICKYMNSKSGKYNSACKYCPLYAPGWCRNAVRESRLSPAYHDSKVTMVSDRRMVGNLQWEIVVAGYLKWITTELVRRNVYTKLRRPNELEDDD